MPCVLPARIPVSSQTSRTAVSSNQTEIVRQKSHTCTHMILESKVHKNEISEEEQFESDLGY